MAAIKSYTDLEQSKKLAEILPLGSADMYYWCADHYPKEDWIIEVGTPDDNYECICAWSLAALLDIMPNNENISTNFSKGGYRISNLEYTNNWFVDYEDETNDFNNCITSADNPVDACYEMILKLHELNLL